MKMHQLLPMFSQLGTFFKEGMKHWAESGGELDVDTLSFWIAAKMADWDPQVKGVSLLDDTVTRPALAQFVAGLIINTFSLAE